ncbi:MAG: AcrB/AcrD/AcrF family protein [Planctomycetes bacterium]|nr:AcrB/AcrD/AcrF family protein [Planctomycetota bacterium]
MRIFTDIAVRQRSAVAVLVLAIVLMGVYSYAVLPRESQPDIKVPLITVVVPLPEAAPEDVENNVTVPLERQLKNLKGLDELSSVSSEGVSITTCKFLPSVTVEDALQKVREKYNIAKTEFPADAEDETISELSFSEFPIITISLYGADLSVLQPLAEKMKDELEQVPGVLGVDLAGNLEPQIEIEINPEKLASFRLPVNQLIQTLSGENVDISAGGVDTGNVKPSVRLPGAFKTAEDVNSIVVYHVEGRPIYLRDVATARRTYKEPTSYARESGKPAVSLSVRKRAGENIILITEIIKRGIAEAKAQRFPVEINYTISGDQSDQIKAMVSDLENNVLSGLVLVLLCVFFAMGLRNAMFVSFAIPLSMLMTFVIVKMMGMTLNMMVLFSLVLANGMLVDNAIVVIENIYRHLNMGKPRVKAVLDGTSEVAWPITTSTLTTLAAFGPMLFWPGIIGDFMSYLPLTVIIVLTCSLFVALVVNPVMAVLFMKRTAHGEGGLASYFTRTGTVLVGAYEVTLRRLLAWPKTTVIGGLVLLVLSFMMLGALGKGVEFFPEVEPRVANVTITGPDGMSLETSDKLAREIEKRLPKSEDIESIQTSVGTGGGNFFEASGDQSHRATVTLHFKKDSERKGSPTQYLEQLRTLVADIPGAEIEVKKQDIGPPTGAKVNIEVSTENQADLVDAARKVRAIVAEVPDVVDLRDDHRAGKPEFKLTVDRQKAALMGMNTQWIGNFVKMLINGRRIGGYDEGTEERDIVVRLPAAQRNDPTVLESILISDVMGNPVPLSTVARFDYVGGAGSLRRKESRRIITVSSGVTAGTDENVVRAEVLKRLEQARAGGVFPAGTQFRFTGESEDQAEAATFLMQAFVVALLLIGMILVAQFNSALQTTIVMTSVIMSFIGVNLSLILHSQKFGIIMTGIGVVSLAGVVVNNAIVLIDFINIKITEGMDVKEACVEAGKTRMRPVLLTAVTTMLGLLPMVLGISFDFFTFSWIFGGDSVAWWKPMATAVSWGLAVATFLTTLYVPTLYLMTYRVSLLFQRLFARFVQGEETPVVQQVAAAEVNGKELEDAYRAASEVPQR